MLLYKAPVYPVKKTAFRFCVYFQPPCPPGHHGLALTLFSLSFLPCIVKQPCLFFHRGSAVLCDGEYEYILSVKKCQHPIPLFFVFFHFFLFFSEFSLFSCFFLPSLTFSRFIYFSLFLFIYFSPHSCTIEHGSTMSSELTPKVWTNFLRKNELFN